VSSLTLGNTNRIINLSPAALIHKSTVTFSWGKISHLVCPFLYLHSRHTQVDAEHPCFIHTENSRSWKVTLASQFVQFNKNSPICHEVVTIKAKEDTNSQTFTRNDQPVSRSDPNAFYRRKQQTMHGRYDPNSPNHFHFITVSVTFLLLLVRHCLQYIFFNYAIQSNKKIVTNYLKRLTETLYRF
jgi:hypothetical protein